MSITRNITRDIPRNITKGIDESFGPVNLLTNGGFESGVTSWAVQNDLSLTAEATIVFVGAGSGKLTTGATGNNISQAVSTVAGRDYICSSMVFLDATATSGYVYAATSPYSGVISSSASTTTKGTWVKITGTFTAVGAVTYIGCGCTAGSGVITYFDEVQAIEN